MKVCYIPATTMTIATASATGKDMGVLEKVIHSAIQSAIVDPFTQWCSNAWVWFMNTSHYVCLFTAMGGVIFWICGIEKGKKVAIIALLTYVGLRILSIFVTA